MPEDISLDDNQKKQLDTNIKNMLGGGASQEDVMQYANDYKTKFAVKKKEPSQPTSINLQGGVQTQVPTSTNSQLNDYLTQSRDLLNRGGGVRGVTVSNTDMPVQPIQQKVDTQKALEEGKVAADTKKKHIEQAIENTANYKIVQQARSKGYLDKVPSKDEMDAEKAILTKKLQDGDLTLTKDATGQPALSHPRGFLESIANSFNHSIDDPIAAYDYHKALVTGDTRTLVQMAEDEKDKQGRIPEKIDNGGAANFAGGLIGGLPKMGVEIAAGGGTPLGTAAVFGTEGAYTGIKHNTDRLYNEILSKKDDPNSQYFGISKEDAMKKALHTAAWEMPADFASNAALGLVGGEGEGLFSKLATKAPDVASKDLFVDALKNTLKNTAKFSAVTGGGEGVKTGIEDASGFDRKLGDYIENTASGAKEGALMKLAFDMVHVGSDVYNNAPKYLKATAKEYLATQPQSVVDYNLGLMGEKGQQIKQSLDEYRNVREQFKGIVPDEQLGTFANWQQKINSITEENKALEATKVQGNELAHTEIDKKIEANDAQIKDINDKIEKYKKTGKIPEFDDLGNPLNKDAEKITPTDENTTTNGVPKEKGSEEAQIITPKVVEGVGDSNEPIASKEGSPATTEPIEATQPTKEEIAQLNQTHKDLSNEYLVEHKKLVDKGIRGDELENDPKLQAIKKQINTIEDYFSKNKIAQPTEEVKIKELNKIGLNLRLDRPRRSDYAEGKEGDIQFVNDNIKHNKNVDEIVAGLPEGIITDSNGTKYSVEKGFAGVRVAQLGLEGEELNHVVYRHGKRLSAEIPFTNGFKFEPKKETSQPTAEVKVEEPNVSSKVEDFDLNKIKKISGKLGEQGFTEDGTRALLTKIGIDVKGKSLEDMIEYLKNNPKDLQKLVDYTKENPIEIHKLSNGSYDIADGNHRASILYYAGIENVPSIIKEVSNNATESKPYNGALSGKSPTEQNTNEVVDKKAEAGSVGVGDVKMNDVDAKRMNQLNEMIKPEMYYSEEGQKKLVEINKEIKQIESKYGKHDLILEHGTPHDFDKFQLEKIGTGEGHQAFGHGLYFTENSKIAKSYAEKLSKDKEGIVYQVKIKDGKLNDWLEWRDALSDSQAEKVSSVVKGKKAEYEKYLETAEEKSHTGAAEQLFNEDAIEDERPLQAGAVYSDLRDAFGSQEATRIMQEAGIDGVKYKTKGGKGEDFNYVVFNPESIVIENKQSLKETPKAETKATPIVEEQKAGTPKAEKSEPIADKETPPTPPINSSGDSREGDGGGGKVISKQGLKEEGFVKNFDEKSGQTVANNAMDKLVENAKSNGVSTEHQAEIEVRRIIDAKDLGTSSEYDIMTAAYHAMNIDEQIKKAIDSGDNDHLESLYKKREEANTALRILGNNTGRNLGLFSYVYNKVGDSGISVVKNEIAKVSGLKDVPETVKGLTELYTNKEITKKEYETALPFVKKIEQVVKEKNAYEAAASKNIETIKQDEIVKAIEEARKQGFKEGVASKKTDTAKEKKSKQIKDIATALRTSAEMDRFLKGANGDIQKSGISFDNYKKVAADILDGIADVVAKGEDVGKYIREQVAKLKDIDKPQLIKDIEKIYSLSQLPTKESLLDKIGKLAKNEGVETITKDMVNSGLIQDVINHSIHEDLPAEKVIEHATNELKKVLPKIEKSDVEDAYLRTGDFKKDQTTKVATSIQEKKAEVKIITTKENKVKALEAASEFSEATTPKERQRIKSEYEQGLDNRLKELNDYHKETEKILKDALNDEIKEPKSRLEDAKAAVENRIQKIRDEIAAKKRDVKESEPPLHKDVELERLEEVEKSLIELRDKYLPKEKEAWADEKVIKQREKSLVNEISDLNDQINSLTRNKKKETVADTTKIEALKSIRDAKKDLLDKLVPDTEKIKKEQEKLREKLADINAQKDHVVKEKEVFQQAIKSPKKVNDALIQARRDLSDTYSRNGLALERGDKKPILVEREYQAAKEKIENDDNLSEDEKKEQLKELEGKRNMDLVGSKQGVLNNLSDAVKGVREDLKNRIAEAIKNDDTETAEQLTKAKEQLDKALAKNNTSGEKVEDITNKVLQGISDKKEFPKDLQKQLKEIEKQTEGNHQLSSNELAAQRIKKQYESEIKRNTTKINSGITTRLEASKFDFRVNRELGILHRQREITKGKLQGIEREAMEKRRTWVDKALGASTKNLVSGVATNIRVHTAGAAKFVADGLVDLIGSKLFRTHWLTQSPEATLKGVKEGFAAIAKFKNKEAADRYIAKKYSVKEKALSDLSAAEESGDNKAIEKATKQYEKATLDHAFSTLYNAINANSLESYWQVLSQSATDYDIAQGKAVKKTIADMQTKLGKIGYVADGWIRMHGAAKKSLSGRSEMARSFYNTLKFYQDNNVPLDATTLAHAELIASIGYDNGTFTNKNALSKQINSWKNSRNAAVRYPTKFLFAVSTIATNIAKRGIDYSVGGAEGSYRLLKGAKEGMKLNAAEGKEFDGFIERVKEGIKKMPLEERVYIQGVLNRQAIGASLAGLALWGLANGSVKYGGTYDDLKKRKIIGSDGHQLEHGQWEFFGWRTPKLLSAMFNHLPAFLSMSLAANAYQIHKADGNKDTFHEFADQYAATVDEVVERLPFQTVTGLLNPYKVANTVTDRVTKIPLAKEGEGLVDKKERENKTFDERVKNNTGFGFLNPEKTSSSNSSSGTHHNTKHRSK